MEMKRKSQKRPQNPYLQQLTAKADEQGEKLTALRKVQDQVDSYKLSNSALGMSEMILYADVLVLSDLLYQQGRKKLESQLVFCTSSSHIFACPWSLFSCLLIESFRFEGENKLYEYEIKLEVFARVLKKKTPRQTSLLLLLY